MRYANTHPSAACQARSRRIGRCARCHAPVLSDEEHYGDGAALVHGACGEQRLDPTSELRATTTASSRPPAQPARRMRRIAATGSLHPPLATGKV